MPKEVVKNKKTYVNKAKTKTSKEKVVKANKAREATSEDSRIHLFVRGKRLDFGLVAIVLVLVTVGLVMLLSASTPYSLRTEGDSYFYFTKQLKFAIAGIILMFIISKIDYRIFNSRIAWLAYFGGIRIYVFSFGTWHWC